MAKINKLTRYFWGLGVSFFIISLYALISAQQMWASYEDYQKEVNKEMNDLMVIAGQIIMILSAIMFVISFITLYIHIRKQKMKREKTQAQPVRQKNCPECGIDITNLAICSKCGHILETT